MVGGEIVGFPWAASWSLASLIASHSSRSLSSSLTISSSFFFLYPLILILMESFFLLALILISIFWSLEQILFKVRAVAMMMSLRPRKSTIFSSEIFSRRSRNSRYFVSNSEQVLIEIEIDDMRPWPLVFMNSLILFLFFFLYSLFSEERAPSTISMVASKLSASFLFWVCSAISFSAWAMSSFADSMTFSGASGSVLAQSSATSAQLKTHLKMRLLTVQTASQDSPAHSDESPTIF